MDPGVMIQKRKQYNRFPLWVKTGQPRFEKLITTAASPYVYPSDTTKGNRAIVRALLMATVNSR